MANLESTASVLEALSHLYSLDSGKDKKEIDRWLKNFQKKTEAWTVADYLLKQKDANLETQLFAAQTLKLKVTLDLSDLDSNARLQLRDSLVELLWTFSTGPKSVMIQLCLALADLAIQLLNWKTVVSDIVDRFGQSSEGANCLLEFLKVLPEEMQSNNRLPLNDEEYKTRAKELIDDNAEQVLNLLTIYMQSSGNSRALQEQIFKCLNSWIYTGSMNIKSVVASPLFELAFEGLNSEELFDVAADVITEIIRETRDVQDYRDVIEQIYPRFAPMLIKLRECINAEENEMVNGYCCIFTEAGDAYVSLIASHPEAFGVLLEGIRDCAAYSDLEVVEMTFKFWYELTNVLESDTYRSALPPFIPYYDELVDIMIKHLQYPPDEEEMTAQERDEFRDFRHHMGDTLKDCCRILTPQRCLAKPLNILTQLLSQSNSTWQQIEAPIFSLRAMGSEVPSRENEVMPVIMDMLSKLPDHPKIRYAATLVISRYSFWTEHHPQYITYQLNFISSGFGNEEVAAASALALKHLCKDCNVQLVNYVSQLQMFYVNVAKSLAFRDQAEVTEAICHVIAVLPTLEIQNALQSFCLPVVQDLHALASKGKEGTPQMEVVKIGDIAEQIGTFFELIKPDVPVGQPHPCVEFIVEIMPVFDLVLTNFGDVFTVCEPICRCYSEMIGSYGRHLLPIITQIMERMVNAFEATGHGAYVWVASKLVSAYVKEQEMTGLCWELIKKMSELLFIKMQTTPLHNITDAIADYFRLVNNVVNDAPTLLLQDASFISTVFRAGLAVLSMKETHCVLSVLSFYRRLLKLEVNRDLVLSLFKEFGGNLVAALINGSIEFYSYQVTDDATLLLRSLGETFPNEATQWVATVMSHVSEEHSSVEKKNDFMNAWALAINEQQYGRLRQIFSRFLATCKRSDKV
ncbi:hypothetical protein G6F57_005936 [Rhizopus arrhizus]|uniref:Importin N-terminal domain-containing protein n=1 Tax=Rhizopus oryzae TaxID=64495 RepID=A0A9P6XF83_RHIOR|nr:hypothetical protein G6F30_005964 [Rhizopus arrhizus]KAG1419309.1 hypothetical protein G6F58_004674 [Rhizopus delemar]KAG0982422.1 hypothetical protein G6F29_006311 [Rhizopus arrhizus]KAG0994048.1 hypothetical protein G6F28_006113 [Rhizopus arrhizus]KAG1008021.1 hypothetical protein G6F27_006882 [Rhizopus arrhizus]